MVPVVVVVSEFECGVVLESCVAVIRNGVWLMKTIVTRLIVKKTKKAN